MTRDDDFLSRWSRRKHAARRGDVEQAPPTAPPAPPVAAAPAALESEKAGKELPPVESLTPDSDFTPFMRDEVDPGMRRQALKALFRDPRFNVMDGLDVYIDDYSKPDPIPAEWLGKLQQMARLGDYVPPEAKSAQQEGALEPAEGDAIPPAIQEVAAGAEAQRADTPNAVEPEPDSTQS